jgi:hypothetical protein
MPPWVYVSFVSLHPEFPGYMRFAYVVYLSLPRTPYPNPNQPPQYHLPSCMRLLEASHTVEILRDAGPDGMHVKDIAERNGAESGKLGAYFSFLVRLSSFSFADARSHPAHILRLLATHHILLERTPDVFATNRISSLVDSGKDWGVCVKRYATSFFFLSEFEFCANFV